MEEVVNLPYFQCIKTSLRKVVRDEIVIDEKMLVYDKHVISKAMFESIFSSVTSNEAFVRSLLQTINKIVFEAAAQSGNKETVAELEGTRRTSVGASQVVEVEGTTSKFDVALLQPLLFRLSSLPRTFELFFSLQFF